MRTALVLFALAAACASTQPQPAPGEKAAQAAQQAAPPMNPPTPVQQNEPPVPPTEQPAPNPHPGVMTASQAAQAYAQGQANAVGGKIMQSVNQAEAPAGSDDSPCTSDADCAFTRVAQGACCPMLCAPRVVTKKRAQELDSAAPACNGGKPCPVPACRPPRQVVRPACVTNRCIAQPVAPDQLQ